MRVVLDANIYISGMISKKGNPFKILQRWKGSHFDLLISQPIVDEIIRVTGYERIKKKYPKIHENQIELMGLIAEEGTLVNPKTRFSLVTADESDNRYFECAIEGGAEYIVSGDRHLLDIGVYRGIRVLTPAVFLTLLDMEK
jgi:putative PIN family toxin of toxin-antitoxin system